MIEVGSHVVCIDDSFGSADASFQTTAYFNLFKTLPHRPVKGVVYTVREIRNFAYRDVLALLLVEVVNLPMEYRYGFMEMSFLITRFKPLKKLRVDDFVTETEDA